MQADIAPVLLTFLAPVFCLKWQLQYYKTITTSNIGSQLFPSAVFYD
jgi:hypothetical protein